MNAKHSAALDAAITSIKKQWGQQALVRLADLPDTSESGLLPTPFPELNRIIGGIPYGRITELLGIVTSGKRTLTYHLIAAAQAARQFAIYVDLLETFDPIQAAFYGVNTEKLVLVRPVNLADALDIACELLENADVGILVLDAIEPAAMDADMLAQTRRLLAPLSKRGSIFLMLNEPAQHGRFACPFASFQLRVEHRTWLQAGRDVIGYQTQITIAKNKLGAEGQSAVIELRVGAA